MGLGLNIRLPHVYWTVHHLDSWIKRDQLDVTCFIISLFKAQHVSDVNTSLLRSLRLICFVISWVVLLCKYGNAKTSIRTEQYNPRNNKKKIISRKLLRMDVLTPESCWALNNEIINKRHQVGLSLFNYTIAYLNEKQIPRYSTQTKNEIQFWSHNQKVLWMKIQTRPEILQQWSDIVRRAPLPGTSQLLHFTVDTLTASNVY